MSTSFAKNFMLACVLLLGFETAHAFSSLARNDYYPLYTTQDPHTYLYTRIKDQLQGRTTEEDKLNRASLSISPFGQNANIGKDICNNDSELGSLNAKWAMIGLMMGDIPNNKSFTPSILTARNVLYPGTAPTAVINDPKAIDSEQKFGFFQMPATYRKRGIRFEFCIGLFDDLGLCFQGGASNINFTICDFENLTGTPPTCPGFNTNLTETNVNEYLMCEVRTIADELNLCLENFHETSIEDMRLLLFWRHAFMINEDKQGWEKFLVIPHLAGGFIAGAGKEKDQLWAFGLPFGNNGHNAFSFKGGVDLDFTETIEIGWEVGCTYFFDNHFDNYFVPTSELQQGIYPFKTGVDISPGFNWHFGLNMNARHFLGKLSFYAQWVILEHTNDTITVCNGDKAFKPYVLEKRSGWKAQVVNTAMNYDVSDNISLGFLWQAPVSQRNVFRSTTVMFGFYVAF